MVGVVQDAGASRGAQEVPPGFGVRRPFAALERGPVARSYAVI